MDARLADALLTGKASGEAGVREWSIGYSKDCQRPIGMRFEGLRSDPKTKLRNDIALRYKVRCRKCNACLRAKRNYWGYAATNMTRQAMEEGRRTWFGTLLWSQPEREAMAQRAKERAEATALGPVVDWTLIDGNWDNPECETRFALLRDECLKDVQRYWKRLRKAGCQFRYFVVFERHKNGWPHAHFLLHEAGDPIRKRVLQGQWPHGFTNVSIVGGRSKNAAAPERAAWYVVKYLSKSDQSRQLASAGYRPAKARSLDR